VTAPLLDDRLTVTGLGAAAERLTVQFDVPGALTVDGEQVKLETWGGATTLNVTVRVTPLRDAITGMF